MPSPMPRLRIAEAKASGRGIMCGRGDSFSFTVSMSNRTAPGIWPARYSASGSRFIAGRYQEPSTTTMSGAFSRWLSHSVETRGFGIVIPLKSSRKPRSGYPGSIAPAAGGGSGSSLRSGRDDPLRRRGLDQRDPHAAVLLALLLDIGDGDAADLAGAADMRAAAGLEVDALDLDEAHAAGAARRLHRHGLDEGGVGVELRVGDPTLADRRVAFDERVELLGQLGLVEPGLRNVEVEPAVAVADGAAGDRVGQYDAQEVERGVHPHPGVAPVPVERGRDLIARRHVPVLVGRQMQDGGAVRPVDRVRDRDRGPVRPRQGADVARLPAALGIEDGAVEHDPAFGRDGDDPRGAVAGIGVVAKDKLRRGHRPAGSSF